MPTDLTRLTQEVSEAKTVMASAKALIEGTAQALRDKIAELEAANADAATVVAAMNTFADDLDASANDLQGAVVANTPASGDKK